MRAPAVPIGARHIAPVSRPSLDVATCPTCGRLQPDGLSAPRPPRLRAVLRPGRAGGPVPTWWPVARVGTGDEPSRLHPPGQLHHHTPRHGQTAHRENSWRPGTRRGTLPPWAPPLPGPPEPAGMRVPSRPTSLGPALPAFHFVSRQCLAGGPRPRARRAGPAGRSSSTRPSRGRKVESGTAAPFAGGDALDVHRRPGRAASGGPDIRLTAARRSPDHPAARGRPLHCGHQAVDERPLGGVSRRNSSRPRCRPRRSRQAKGTAPEWPGRRGPGMIRTVRLMVVRRPREPRRWSDSQPPNTRAEPLEWLRPFFLPGRPSGCPFVG